MDFLRALAAAGVSHRKSAVPAAERSVHSWFMQVSIILPFDHSARRDQQDTYPER